jgi:hypothetical protein
MELKFQFNCTKKRFQFKKHRGLKSLMNKEKSVLFNSIPQKYWLVILLTFKTNQTKHHACTQRR